MLKSAKEFYNDYTKLLVNRRDFMVKHPKGVILEVVATTIATPVIAIGMLATIGGVSNLVQTVKSKTNKKVNKGRE